MSQRRKEGRKKWEEAEEQLFWKDRDRRRGFVFKQPTYTGNILGVGEEEDSLVGMYTRFKTEQSWDY